MSITIVDFKNKLAEGPLKATSMVSDVDSSLMDAAYDNTILNYINQGLIDISTRLPIITRQVDLIFETGRNHYPIVDSAITGYLDITDTFNGITLEVGEPVIDTRFVKLLEIKDDKGIVYTLDTNHNITTPSYNSVRFTNNIIEEMGTKVRLTYQAKHSLISDILTSIDLPPNLETALLLYVASLSLSHMNGAEHVARGDRYFGFYLGHVDEDRNKNNSSTSEIGTDNRFSDGGFV